MRGRPELLLVIHPSRDFCLSSSYRWGPYWRYFTVYNYIYIYTLSLQGLSRAVNNSFVN